MHLSLWRGATAVATFGSILIELQRLFDICCRIICKHSEKRSARPTRLSLVALGTSFNKMASHFRASTKSLSRVRLEQLANWIRDDLDLLVAREGPDALHPDDCIFLHEFFISLRQAHHLTVSDLRATGIHKAISDISGVATRWPARLCDDCDRILSIWSVKFGSLTILHPFLYGRGGRLEGIASSTEYSKEVSSVLN